MAAAPRKEDYTRQLTAWRFNNNRHELEGKVVSDQTSLYRVGQHNYVPVKHVKEFDDYYIVTSGYGLIYYLVKSEEDTSEQEEWMK